MEALKVTAWLVCIVMSTWMVFEFVGMRLMLAYFPEGKKWWVFPMQIVSLGLFAASVLNNPFN